jgi:hypothetical protein
MQQMEKGECENQNFEGDGSFIVSESILEWFSLFSQEPCAVTELG